jgi:hypothetical protein
MLSQGWLSSMHATAIDCTVMLNRICCECNRMIAVCILYQHYLFSSQRKCLIESDEINFLHFCLILALAKKKNYADSSLQTRLEEAHHCR